MLSATPHVILLSRKERNQSQSIQLKIKQSLSIQPTIISSLISPCYGVHPQPAAWRRRVLLFLQFLSYPALAHGNLTATIYGITVHPTA